MIGKITIAIVVLAMITVTSVTPLVQAFKLTRTSYTDGYNEGYRDATTGQKSFILSLNLS